MCHGCVVGFKCESDRIKNQLNACKMNGCNQTKLVKILCMENGPFFSFATIFIKILIIIIQLIFFI